MRLLTLGRRGRVSLTREFVDDIPPYAILSHRWGADEDEVTFNDLENGLGKSKIGFTKLRFCGKQAQRDKIDYFWVDTCCINKANHVELSEAITSMFRWYRNAAKCYVYLADVTVGHHDENPTQCMWESAFRQSEWFTRGWTLQELLAPAIVEFFSQEGTLLGDKKTLERQAHEITQIPVNALRGGHLAQFPVRERLQWTVNRKTKRKEDKAYCLLGIFDIFMPLMYGEGDNAFKRLQEEIARRTEPLAHAYWIVTRQANSLFTGRQDLLRELNGIVHHAVTDLLHQEQCHIVISGMGGQGKSEICLQLANRVRPLFWGVFWIDVSTTDLAERSFLNIAEKLSIPAETWEDARLGIANLQHPWLLVLDNGDDPDVDYQRYFPGGTLGVVLLTSRNEECHQYATERHVALDGLADGEAQELLLRAAKVPHDRHQNLASDAQVVASLLRSHPLALIQAGAYVARGHCTLAQYPQVFAQHRKRLLAFRPAQAQSRYRDVYATFEASAAILQSSHTESARDALQLLPVLATCGPNQLPLGLFEAGWKGAQAVLARNATNEDDNQVDRLTPWHVSHLLPLMQADISSWDFFRLVEAVQLLKALSLVSTDSHEGSLSVSMHPLTHAWARDRQEVTIQHDSWVTTGCLLALSRDDRQLWRQRGRQLQPHLQALTSWEMSRMFASAPHKKIACILVNCGWLMYDLRDDAKLFALMNNSLTHLGLDRDKAEKEWVGAYELTARNLYNYGKVKQAVSQLEQVVRIREQTLAEDHPHRLASQHALAMAYQANGQVTQAVSLLEQVVRIREQTLAEDHPDRLASQQVLATAYQANGQVTQAVSLLEQVVRIQEQTLAEDHPDRLASQQVLAMAYQANGQVTQAASLLEQVVRIQEQTLAEDHPHRLASQHTLGIAYQANGQVTEAASLLEQVVRIQEQTLAEDHPDRLASQHTLGIAYQANGQVTEAVSLLEQVVRIEEQTLAEDHPHRLASQHTLGMAYQANGQVTEAVSLLEQVVRIREQTLAEDHPDRLVSQHALVTMYWDLGRREISLKMMKQVVEIRRQVLNEHHPDRTNSEGWLQYFETEIRKLMPR